MGTERIIKKEDTGKFGEIVAGEYENEKTLHGMILFVDHFGKVTFIDNDGISYLFTRTAVKSFTEKEFKQ